MTSSEVRKWSEPSIPHPPRFWWLRRITLGVVVLLLILSGLRVWWGWEANRRFDRVIRELAARGQPIRAEDLDLPIADDDDANAAVHIVAAANAIDPTVYSPSQSNEQFPEHPPFPWRWHRMAERAVAANSRALELAHRARKCSQVDWGIRPRTPVINTLLPSLNDARNLANVLADAMLHAHFRGDDALALERARDLLFVAKAVDRQPFVVSHLVSAGINALACARLQLMAPTMKIGGLIAATTTASSGAATRAQVQAVIADLLCDDDGSGANRAMLSERVMSLDTILALSRGNPLTEPLLKLESLRVIRDCQPLLSASTQPTWKDVTTVLASTPTAPAAARNVLRLSNVISSIVAPTYGRFLQSALRVRVLRRLTAAALAVQLYRADHGDWPATLEQLVPQYLPAVPRDAFAVDAPIRFALIPGGLPDGSSRPVLYSVGEDGRDETSKGWVPSEPQFGWTRNADQWCDLVLWAPTVSASQQNDLPESEEADLDPPTTTSSETVDD